MPSVKAAVIGCGGMGRSHMKAIARVADLELVAIADARPESLVASAAAAGGAAVYADAAELLSEVAPELVTIATNGPSHAELTIAAAEAGARYIFCEKPMATTLRDARRMIDVCAERGARLAINHTRRWSPAVQRLRDALADAIIGDPRSIQYTLGAGRMGCNGSHVIDQVRMLTGADIVDVVGWVDTTGTPDPRGPRFYDPGGHALMHLSNGARLYLDQMEDLGVPGQLNIVGSIGRARIEDVLGVWDVRARRAADRDKPMLAYGCPLEPATFDVSDCPGLSRWDEVQADAYRNLLSDEPVLCSGEDGYVAIEAIMAIHLSDRRGHAVVPLPLSGDDLDLRIDFT